jgi:protein phosphatase 2C family protein 2/3
MGQTLSEPIRDKITTNGNNKRFLYAASSMQGWRTRKH